MKSKKEQIFANEIVFLFEKLFLSNLLNRFTTSNLNFNLTYIA